MLDFGTKISADRHLKILATIRAGLAWKNTTQNNISRDKIRAPTASRTAKLPQLACFEDLSFSNFEADYNDAWPADR